ncbi:type I-E CRISPR-associated protein Cse2/CasB [Pusillimonas sp. TS35]|nr:type I-E CRISPR-associated protein Cse2/CasB [Pusillimonas sp. TS35]
MNDFQVNLVRQWWKALQPPGSAEDTQETENDGAGRTRFSTFGRAARARLRRAPTATELLLEPAVLQLADRLIATGNGAWPLRDEPLGYEYVAWMAGVLAAVKSDASDGKSLAWRLGHASARASEPPAMSELRFRRLQRLDAMPNLLASWRRAVLLAGATADVGVLGADLLDWMAENERHVAPSQSVKFRWAHDYYLTAKAQKEASIGNDNKENAA